jgi:hypothetical protein
VDLAKALIELREELQNLDAAIESLGNLQRMRSRRGRSRALLAPAKSKSKRSRKRPGGAKKRE